MPPAEHAYVVFSLICVGLFLVVLALEPGWRLILLASGLLASPAGILDRLFVPAYWQPVHLLGRELSIEGILFSFATGGLALWCALRGHRTTLEASVPVTRAATRYVLSGGLAMSVLLTLVLVGRPVMDAALVAMMVTALTCLAARPDAARVAVRGAAGFGLLYALVLVALVKLLPAMSSYWTGGTWGIRVLGLPVEEFVWAVAYGALWPLVLVMVLGLGWRQVPRSWALPSHPPARPR